jgi:hypothetical protein
MLGGWANPHAEPATQAKYLSESFFGEYFLTQVVSHHDRAKVDAFLDAAARKRVTMPGVFGVFYYRSANPRTLETLRQFLPVPTGGLTEDFARGATPEDVCAATIRSLRAAGVRNIYVSNLPVRKARQTLAAILKRV